MKREELAAIRARAEKATAGPWYWEARGVDGLTQTLFAGTGYADFGAGPTPVHDLNLLNTDDREWDRNREANRTFIAHAREDVPALLAEVERLRAFATSVINSIDDEGLREWAKDLRQELDGEDDTP